MFGNNLNAREAIKAGFGGVLCSDYTPMALFHSIFLLERLGILPLPEAVNMASLNPAREAGISGFAGSLEAGKGADIIIADASGEVPRVLKTFAEGREIFSTAKRSADRKDELPREAILGEV